VIFPKPILRLTLIKKRNPRDRDRGMAVAEMRWRWRWIWKVLLIISVVEGNSEGDALYTLRRSLSDPDNVLQSWDPTLVNPCTWFHITCNQDNRVTRLSVYLFLSFFLSFFLNLV
jgi:hypothetical protein